MRKASSDDLVLDGGRHVDSHKIHNGGSRAGSSNRKNTTVDVSVPHPQHRGFKYKIVSFLPSCRSGDSFPFKLAFNNSLNFSNNLRPNFSSSNSCLIPNFNKTLRWGQAQSLPTQLVSLHSALKAFSSLSKLVFNPHPASYRPSQLVLLAAIFKLVRRDRKSVV